LPGFSAYSRRYVGYGIDRGKLDLDLEYKLDASKLDADNHLVLDRFTFGEAVEGKAMLSLPIPLAVAVMRDSSGRIDLDLPVHGNLDDPSFSLLKVLGKTFVNIIMKAATTPFALIPMPGGGGGDPSRIGFEPGSAALSPTEEERLVAVAEVLGSKPALNVEIVGHADPELDAAALRSMQIDAAVREAAFQSLSRRERTRIGTPESLEVEPERRLELLERLYRDRIGGAPPDDIGSPKDAEGASAEEARTRRSEALTRALGASVKVEESDLRSLARSRAAHIQSTLLADGRLAPGRVFLRDVEIGAAGDGGGVFAQLVLSTR
jgi:hypothetical protein